MSMVAQGQSLTEIQEVIDTRYAAQRDDRTPTPVPPLGYVPPPYRALGGGR